MRTPRGHDATGCDGIQETGAAGPIGLRNGQALPPFGAAPLENDTAVLRAHPHEETVGAPTAAAIGLERALHGTPGRGRVVPAKPRWYRPPPALSTSEARNCTNYGRCLTHRRTVDSPPFPHKATARKVFHNCGKSCGNPKVSGSTPRKPQQKQDFQKAWWAFS